MVQYQSGIKTKRNIYLASEKLFYENGYKNTTITNITDYANANRGSFYHHYQNKLQLGIQTHSNFESRNSRIKSLFGSIIDNAIDNAIGVCLNVKTFWYLFFHDEKIRRFSVELAHESVLQINKNTFFYNVCIQLSKKQFTDKQMDFISITNIGLGRQLNIDIYSHTNEYTYGEVSDYYMSTMFRLFDIDQDIIEHILLRSKELFSKCIVTNEGFYVTYRLKTL